MCSLDSDTTSFQILPTTIPPGTRNTFKETKAVYQKVPVGIFYMPLHIIYSLALSASSQLFVIQMPNSAVTAF